MRALFSEIGLKAAMVRNKFHIYFEPQFYVENGTIAGAAVRLRLQTANGVIEITEEVIRELELAELIHYLDYFVLRRVCRLLEQWRKRNLISERISLKFSRYTLEMTDFAERFERIMNAFPGTMSTICIEVAGTCREKNAEVFAENCRLIRQSGAELSIDRFGAGSTENYLVTEPWFSETRIDAQLIKKLETRTMNYLVVMACLKVSSEFGKDVTAVGVTSLEQLSILKKLGCKRFQGALTGGEVPAGEFAVHYLSREVERGII